jgi:hypothetical protein
VCVQVPCVYIPHTASSVTARNNCGGHTSLTKSLETSVVMEFVAKSVIASWRIPETLLLGYHDAFCRNSSKNLSEPLWRSLSNYLSETLEQSWRGPRDVWFQLLQIRGEIFTIFRDVRVRDAG